MKDEKLDECIDRHKNYIQTLALASLVASASAAMDLCMFLGNLQTLQFYSTSIVN